MSQHVPMTEDEAQDLIAMNATLKVVGDLFLGGEVSAEALRMGIATVRRAADVLERIAERLEAT